MMPPLLALATLTLSIAAQEAYPPAPPLFPVHGLGVQSIFYARAGDLSGDGNVDVVTVGLNSNEPMRVHLGTGQGSLLRDAFPPIPLQTTPIVRGLELGDFDGDGDLEPVVLVDSGFGSRFLVFDNDGSGALSQKFGIPFSSVCDRLSVADIEGDGDHDLVFVREPSARLHVMRSNGPTGFSTAVMLQVPAGYPVCQDYALGDYSGDGVVDVVAIQGIGQRALFQYQHLGGTAFSPPIEVTKLTSGARSVSLADIRGDGVLHMATSSFAFSTGYSTVWYENDGRGHFERRQQFQDIDLREPTPDLDGDGREEWLASHPILGYERLLAEGHGVAVSRKAPKGFLGWIQDVADFDSDGFQDLLTIDDEFGDGLLMLACGDGSGALEGVITSQVEGGNTYQSTLVDLDGDGTLDLIAYSEFKTPFFLYRGSGDGQFASLGSFDPAESPMQFVPGDFDGDGRIDLGVVEGARRSIEFFLQGSGGKFAAAGTTRPTQRKSGGFLHAVAIDSNADGRDEIATFDPHTQRLLLAGLDDDDSPAILAALHIPGTRAIHAAIEGTGGREALELLAEGSSTHLSLWQLDQPLASGTTHLTEILPLPILDPAPAWPLFLVDPVRVQDFDSDGVRDVWAVHNLLHSLDPFQSVTSVWSGERSGAFAQANCERSTLVSVPLWTDDLDGDGLSDRAFLTDIAGYFYPSRLQVQRARGGAPFSDPETYLLWDAAHGDVDGDGRTDLAFAFYGLVYTYLNLSGR